ncbi:MAG: hypothetical protein PWQ70_2939 [Clostridiales bacterium]|nr:hypothetical protein [Clostridiales bacterium]
MCLSAQKIKVDCLDIALRFIIRQSPSAIDVPFGTKIKVDCLDIMLRFIIRQSPSAIDVPFGTKN